MLNSRSLVLAALAVLSPALWAQNPPQSSNVPQIPEACVDAPLFGGRTPRAFFESRKGQTACRTELAARKAAYLRERELLERLSVATDGADKVDVQGEAMERARAAWLEKLGECGNCATRLEVRRIPTPGRTEYWYLADGSCQVEGLGVDGHEKSFQAKSRSLLTLNAYRQYAGGFPTVLEYFFVNPATGALMTNPTVPAGTSFDSFISIRGPELPVVGRAAFGYYFRNQTRLEEEAGVKRFVHTFEGERPPRGFRYPTVQETLPSGRKRAVRLLKLSRVQGKWCVTNDGYLRYYTAADLGMDLDYAKRVAEEVLLTTLAAMYERGVGEAP